MRRAPLAAAGLLLLVCAPALAQRPVAVQPLPFTPYVPPVRFAGLAGRAYLNRVIPDLRVLAGAAYFSTGFDTAYNSWGYGPRSVWYSDTGFGRFSPGYYGANSSWYSSTDYDRYYGWEYFPYRSWYSNTDYERTYGWNYVPYGSWYARTDADRVFGPAYVPPGSWYANPDYGRLSRWDSFSSGSWYGNTDYDHSYRRYYGLYPVTYQEPAHEPAPPPQPAFDPTRAIVTLEVDDTDEVWVDDYKLRQPGRQRQFISPELEPGHSYRYTVTVRSLGRERKLQVPVQAGDRQTLLVQR